MTFETLNKSQRSFGLPVGFLMALYRLFNPSPLYFHSQRVTDPRTKSWCEDPPPYFPILVRG